MNSLPAERSPPLLAPRAGLRGHGLVSVQSRSAADPAGHRGGGAAVCRRPDLCRPRRGLARLAGRSASHAGGCGNRHAAPGPGRSRVSGPAQRPAGPRGADRAVRQRALQHPAVHQSVVRLDHRPLPAGLSHRHRGAGPGRALGSAGAGRRRLVRPHGRLGRGRVAALRRAQQRAVPGLQRLRRAVLSRRAAGLSCADAGPFAPRPHGAHGLHRPVPAGAVRHRLARGHRHPAPAAGAAPAGPAGARERPGARRPRCCSFWSGWPTARCAICPRIRSPARW